MQQSTRRFVILVAATLVGGGGLFVAACSTDNGGSTSGDLPTVDSGKDTSSGNSSGGPDSSTTDGGVDADCTKAPALHDNTAFFCPFQAKLADGGNAPDCDQTQICCSPGIPSTSDAGFPPSFCTTSAKSDVAPADLRETTCSAAAGGAQNWEVGNKFNSMWECADKTNCPASEVCCAVTDAFDLDAGDKANIGPNSDTVDIPTACGALQLYRSNGTKCMSACTAGTTVRTCSAADTCTTGTCTAFAGSATKKSSTRDLGYCKL